MDTEYILNCALELGEITALEYAVASSPHGAYAAVRDLVDRNLPMPQDFLSDAARAHLAKVSPEHRYYHALCALDVLEPALKAFTGQAELSVQRKVQSDLAVAQPSLAAWASRVGGGRPAANQVRVLHTSEIKESLVRQILDASCSGASRRWMQDLALMAEAVRWHQAGGGAQFEQMLWSPSPAQAAAVDVAALLAKVRLARDIALRQQRRKEQTLHAKAKAAVKKAARLFDGLGKSDSLRLFVSGSEVVLQGPNSPFKFVLKPLATKGWLLERTVAGRAHTPYDLQLLTRDDVHLANLCVYFSDTPVLDQALALSMFVESGNELEILMKANWFATDDWTPQKSDLVLQAYPQLRDRIPRPELGREPGLALQPSAAEQHWEPYRGRIRQWTTTWAEPLMAAARPLLAHAHLVQDQVASARAQQLPPVADFGGLAAA